MSNLTDTIDDIGARLESAADSVEEFADDVVDEVRDQSWMTWVLWAALAVIIGWGIWEGLWRAAFVAFITLVVTTLPLVIQKWADFRLPRALIFIMVLFAICTLVMGEVFDFYETYWWWDVVLHSGSAVMFGIFGFILIMLVFDTRQMQASPGMVFMFALSFAIAVGALWEIFEFAMDQLFGLNMQKSGIVDTMWDLIVDTLGGIIGAGAGYIYLKRGKSGPVSGLIHDTVEQNERKLNTSAATSADPVTLAPNG